MTLVELMISAVILGMAISATVTLLRAGQDLEFKKDVERQAYRLAFTALERPAYHYYPNYSTLAGTTYQEPMNVTARIITATVLVTVYPEKKEFWSSSDSSCYRRVDARVTWAFEGKSDTVRATKLLAQVR